MQLLRLEDVQLEKLVGKQDSDQLTGSHSSSSGAGSPGTCVGLLFARGEQERVRRCCRSPHSPGTEVTGMHKGINGEITSTTGSQISSSASSVAAMACSATRLTRPALESRRRDFWCEECSGHRQGVRVHARFN